ncbi:hypothetical protein V6N13_112003 [Hibiscus sabdariffa]
MYPFLACSHTIRLLFNSLDADNQPVDFDCSFGREMRVNKYSNMEEVAASSSLSKIKANHCLDVDSDDADLLKCSSTSEVKGCDREGKLLDREW